MKWLYFYLAALSLRIDLPWGTNIKQTKRWAVWETSKKGAHIIIITSNKKLGKIVKWFFFRHFKQQHGVYRSSQRRCSIEKSVLKNSAKFTGKHLCQGLFFNKVSGLRNAILSKKTLAQVLSWEFLRNF